MGFYWGQGGEAPLQGTNPALSAAKIAGSSYLAYWVSFEIKKAILHNEKQMTCRGFAPPALFRSNLTGGHLHNL